jgi:hypothetical protein
MFFSVCGNRRSDTLKGIISKTIKKETVIKTDWYSSYPSAVSRCGHDHIVVNHSRGFRNEQGHTTNSSEGLWVRVTKVRFEKEKEN